VPVDGARTAGSVGRIARGLQRLIGEGPDTERIDLLDGGILTELLVDVDRYEHLVIAVGSGMLSGIT
jgi:hypothetical protein